MLIVMLIIGIITVIVFSGQASFDRTLYLNNVSYDIALSVRQAQSYGMTSQNFVYGGGSVRDTGYGVTFRSATPTSYIFFADAYPAVAANARPDARPGNGLYDIGVTPSELVQTYNLNNGFTVNGFCGKPAGTTKVCTTDSLLPLTALTVTFSRPNSKITILGERSLGSVTFTSACVRITSSSGDSRYVSVSQAGQVQVGLQSIDVACP